MLFSPLLNDGNDDNNNGDDDDNNNNHYDYDYCWEKRRDKRERKMREMVYLIWEAP